MLVSDDQNGIVYRIRYSRPLDEGVALLPEEWDTEQAVMESPAE